MKWNEPVSHHAVEPAVLQSIHASDQEMYPAALPLERLQAWVDAAPELSIEFSTDSDSAPIGVVVALPLHRKSWDALLSGVLKETDVEASHDFGRVGDKGQEEVGIHIFHVERYKAPQGTVLFRGFGSYAISTVLDAARAKGYTILGTSGN